MARLFLVVFPTPTAISIREIRRTISTILPFKTSLFGRHDGKIQESNPGRRMLAFNTIGKCLMSLWNAFEVEA